MASICIRKFNLDKDHSLPFGVVIAKDEAESDFQISYRKLAYLNNYADKVKLLELINEIEPNQDFLLYTLPGGRWRDFPSAFWAARQQMSSHYMKCL